MNIFLCPKSFSSSIQSTPEGNFLKYYLSRMGLKARITDELWETFRFRLIKESTNNEGAKLFIADQRGSFNPENKKIDSETFKEIAPEKEYTNEELLQKTKNYLVRNWADIDFFICDDSSEYLETNGFNNVNVMSLEEFYIFCMTDSATRELLEDF